MKTLSLKTIMFCAVLFVASSVTFAADKNYKRTSVWNVALISTEAGQEDAYLDSLKGYYTSVMDEAMKQKLFLTYKILVGERANPHDWDIMILIEYPNWATFDTVEQKFDAIRAKLEGSLDKADANEKKQMADRAKIRTIFGGKQMQEIQFVK